MREKNIKLLARGLHNPDLLLRQPIKPGPASICPSVASIWPLSGGFFVRLASFREAVYARRATEFGKPMNADMISGL